MKYWRKVTIAVILIQAPELIVYEGNARCVKQLHLWKKP